MDIKLLEDALENKVFEHQSRGVEYNEALDMACREVVEQAGRYLSAAGIFCLRLSVRGLASRIRGYDLYRRRPGSGHRAAILS